MVDRIIQTEVRVGAEEGIATAQGYIRIHVPSGIPVGETVYFVHPDGGAIQFLIHDKPQEFLGHDACLVRNDRYDGCYAVRVPANTTFAQILSFKYMFEQKKPVVDRDAEYRQYTSQYGAVYGGLELEVGINCGIPKDVSTWSPPSPTITTICSGGDRTESSATMSSDTSQSGQPTICSVTIRSPSPEEGNCPGSAGSLFRQRQVGVGDRVLFEYQYSKPYVHEAEHIRAAVNGPTRPVNRIAGLFVNSDARRYPPPFTYNTGNRNGSGSESSSQELVRNDAFVRLGTNISSSGNNGISQSTGLQVGPPAPRHLNKKTNTLYKTEMCRNWAEMGECRYGRSCQFAHGKRELRTVHRHGQWKTKTCLAWLNGGCTYGSRCCYAHEKLDDTKRGTSQVANNGSVPTQLEYTPHGVSRFQSFFASRTWDREIKI